MDVTPRRSIKNRVRIAVLVLLGVAAVSLGVLYRAYHYPMFDVRVNNDEGSFQGYTLFAFTVDDIGLELEKPSMIYLIDMNGEIAHRWRVLGSVQLVKLKPDGNLLYTTRDRSFKQRAGLRELDPFGNVIWYYGCWADHDFQFLPNGNFLIHYIEDTEVPTIGPGEARCPRIIEVTPQKDVVWEWRGEDHLDELTDLLGIAFPVDENLQSRKDDVVDWAHNNSCHVIEENETALKDSRFKEGNILFSYASLNTIGVIDRESGQVLWAWGPETLDGQHNPIMMRNGNLLIFDNGTERGYSRIIELDPLSEEIVWEYSDREAKNPEFLSEFISGSQPLPSGNVFICQGSYRPAAMVSKFYDRIRRHLLRGSTDWSRLFEVNRSNEIVWDVTINQSGDDTVHNIYQATRYSEAYVRPLLGEIKKAEDASKRQLKSLPYLR